MGIALATDKSSLKCTLTEPGGSGECSNRERPNSLQVLEALQKADLGYPGQPWFG